MLLVFNYKEASIMNPLIYSGTEILGNIPDVTQQEGDRGEAQKQVSLTTDQGSCLPALLIGRFI